MSNPKFNFQEKYPGLFAIKQREQKLYFVGGVIRDVFLNRASKDIDILCDCDTRIFARKFADQNKGSFFVMDEERNTSRVILNINHQRQVFDFARLQGKNINEDLALRDFTINAMAVDFDQPGVLIDPLNGQNDLLNGILRCCSRTSFTSDPIRVVRAVRYSISCQATIESETQSLLRKSVQDLRKISGERKRDEFFKILETEKPAFGLELLYQFEILKEFAIDQISEPLRAFQKIAALDHLFAMVEGRKSLDANKEIFENSCNLRLGRFYPNLSQHFSQRNLSDRSEKQLNLFVIFLANFDRSTQENMIKALLLSREEVAKIALLLGAKDDFQKLTEKDLITPRDLYQFFKTVEETGLDLCFHFLANLLSQEAAEINQPNWLHTIEVCEQVISCWFERKEIISPTMLLNGKDMMMLFDLAPGPKIGNLLERLREEQAAGEINSKEQAIDWVEEQLSHQALLDYKR